MATPPTRVSYNVPASGNYSSAAASFTTGTFDVQAGDLIVVQASAERATTIASVTPSASGGSVTWTSQAQQPAATNANVSLARVWTGAVGSTATGITVSLSRICDATAFWGLSATVWRNHGGVGTTFSGSNGTGANSAPSVAGTASCAANSAVQCGVNDWNAADGTTRTWRTINSAAETEATYFRDALHHTVYGGYRADTGAAGSITQGLTAPTGMRWVLVGVEILGTTGSNTGTLSASVPVATASISGTQTDAGTLTASTPTPTASISGQSTNAGTLAASVILATAAITGSSTNAGTLAAATPVPTSSITGTQTNSGTMSASLPKLTASIADQAGTNSGTLSASVPVLTAAVSGTQTNPGTLAASTPVPTSTITGSATNTGTLSASVPRVTAQISDTTVVTGTLSAQVPNLTATVTGQSLNPGSLAANLPRLTTALTGTSANTGTTAASLPLVVGTFVGASVNPGTFTGSLPRPTANIVDFVAVTPPERTYPIPAEVRLLAVPFESRTTAVPAEDRTTRA